MRACKCNLLSFLIVPVTFLFAFVHCEDPYRYFTWKVTYGDIYPLGVKQQVLSNCHSLCSAHVVGVAFVEDVCVQCGSWFPFLQGILINGQFPGPQIDAVTNDNLIINVYNYLREPFLISWYILAS